MTPFVLFVDDDPTTQELMRILLERAGYEVDIAKDGAQACSFLEKKRYPLVITDWEMPQMDGPSLCRFIRSQFLGGYTYTILLTCREGKSSLIHGLDCGADDYLTKPVDEGELLARLQTGKRITTLEYKLRRSKEEAIRLATTDALTGAYNRRYLMTELENELERARREQLPVSVVMCDIDNFKAINDRYGHRMGDAVLEHVVQLINRCCRSKIDWVARYGGEEFALVMPATDSAGAIVVAERVRQALEQTPVEGDRYGVSMTASFGVVTDTRKWPANRLEPYRLLACADRCLYQSKNTGKNKLTFWDETLARDLNESDIETIANTFKERQAA